MTQGHERPNGIELTFFVAASLAAICFGAKFGCDMRALRAENVQLRARLDWWECKQPEQPGSPTLIEAEPIPQEEIDEAVPLTGGLDSLKGVADSTEPPLQGSEPPLYGAVGAAAPNARSGKWPAVRAHYFAEHPHCEFKGCQCPGPFNVHHVQSFHEHPELELDPANLITLCTGPDNHHLYVGHNGDFKDINPHVREDCKAGKWPAKGLRLKQERDAKAAKALSKTTLAP